LHLDILINQFHLNLIFFNFEIKCTALNENIV